MSFVSELLKTEKIPESGIDSILVYKSNFKSRDPRTARHFQNFLVLVRSCSRFLNFPRSKVRVTRPRKLVCPLLVRAYFNRNKEQDCWIGKFDETRKFNISTNHLHYNRSAIEHVMTPSVKKIGIVREPESQFISSFSFYHGGLKTVRPQLLFFGLSPNGIPSWSEEKLNRGEVLNWLRKVFKNYSSRPLIG